jgi:hypothetical protein
MGVHFMSATACNHSEAYIIRDAEGCLSINPRFVLLISDSSPGLAFKNLFKDIMLTTLLITTHLHTFGMQASSVKGWIPATTLSKEEMTGLLDASLTDSMRNVNVPSQKGSMCALHTACNMLKMMLHVAEEYDKNRDRQQLGCLMHSISRPTTGRVADDQLTYFGASTADAVCLMLWLRNKLLGMCGDWKDIPSDTNASGKKLQRSIERLKRCHTFTAESEWAGLWSQDDQVRLPFLMRPMSNHRSEPSMSSLL